MDRFQLPGRFQRVFDAGRAQTVQTQLGNKTAQLPPSFHPPSPLSSSVINNDYQQHISPPAYLLPLNALLQPLFDRSDMLSNFPVIQLHPVAQRVAPSTTGSVKTSLGVLWANWAGPDQDPQF